MFGSRSSTTEFFRQLTNDSPLVDSTAWFKAVESNDLLALNQLRPFVIRFITASKGDTHHLLKHAKIIALKQGNIPMLEFLIAMVNELGGNVNQWLQDHINRRYIKDTISKVKHPSLSTWSEGEIDDLDDNYASDNARELTPFIYAIEETNERLAKFLFDHRHLHFYDYISQEIKYDRGYSSSPGVKGTPLTLAAENGMVNIVALLLDNGVKTEEKHSDTYSCGFLDRSFGYIPEWKNPDLTALLVAAKNKNNHDEKEMLKIAEMLLMRGANYKACNEKGEQAVHLTTSDAMKKLLLSYYTKADLLDYANGHAAVPEYLCCSFTKTRHGKDVIMEKPVIYKGIVFCKFKWLEMNKDKDGISEYYKFIGPDGKTISRHEFDAITELPIDAALKIKRDEFVHAVLETNALSMQIDNMKLRS